MTSLCVSVAVHFNEYLCSSWYILYKQYTYAVVVCKNQTIYSL